MAGRIFEICQFETVTATIESQEYLMNTKTNTVKSAKSVDPFAEFDQAPAPKASKIVTKAVAAKSTKPTKVAPKAPGAKAPKTPAKAVKIVEKPAKESKTVKSSAGSFQVGIIIRGESGTKSKFTVIDAKNAHAAIIDAPAALNKIIKGLGAPTVTAKAKPSVFRMSVIAKDADGHTVSKSGRLEARTLDEALSLAPAALHKLVKASVAA
jgi:hypothetical protein